MNDLKVINEALQEAKKYGLEAEVIWSTLNSIKNNPNQSLMEAIHHGLGEWIK